MNAPLRVMVVDDEPLARERLRHLLADCTDPVVRCVGEAADAGQAQALLSAEAVDVVLLDIHMPGLGGMAVARHILDRPAPPALVFVTADPEHALRAFELNAVDYLTKPVRLGRLQAALSKAQRFLPAATEAATGTPAPPSGSTGTDTGGWLILSDRGRTERVPLADVLYFKAELKYVTVRTVSRTYVLDGSLSELEERHAPHFLRIHRNALVNRRMLRAVERGAPAEGDESEGWYVRLLGLDERLQVSRRHLAAVREGLASL